MSVCGPTFPMSVLRADISVIADAVSLGSLTAGKDPLSRLRHRDKLLSKGSLSS